MVPKRIPLSFGLIHRTGFYHLGERPLNVHRYPQVQQILSIQRFQDPKISPSDQLSLLQAKILEDENQCSGFVHCEI
uniref:Uncharacterized protein n=1 Tax=Arundo donax TaxID=35708 RepID=A0A0A8YUR5_ARUDO